MKKIAIFASGTGSNAQKIVEYFKESTTIEVALIVSNRKKALVLKMAEEFEIEHFVIDRASFYASAEDEKESPILLKKLAEFKIDFIALAGFLWLIPDYLVDAYDEKMLNIHPALLPKYGGKGMYGNHVHEAVKTAGEKESGISIHFVNKKYDEGGIVFQKKCSIDEKDTPSDIAAKVLKLEHEYFPKTIEKVIENHT